MNILMWSAAGDPQFNLLTFLDGPEFYIGLFTSVALTVYFQHKAHKRSNIEKGELE